MKSFDWGIELDEQSWLQWLAGDLKIDGRNPPEMPNETLQSTFVGRSGMAALSEAAAFLNHVAKTKTLPSNPAVLDFACGWGRLYRVMLRSDWNIVGADSEPMMIGTCINTLPGIFLQIPNTPPYSFFSDRQFDLVYVYSLFSHLSQPVATSILSEFARVTKSGATIAFTLLEKSEARRVWSETISGFDARTWETDANAGMVQYLPVGGGFDSMPKTNYGWAYISDAALSNILQRLPFTLIGRDKVEGVPQDVVILRRN